MKAVARLFWMLMGAAVSCPVAWWLAYHTGRLDQLSVHVAQRERAMARCNGYGAAVLLGEDETRDRVICFAGSGRRGKAF